MIGSGPGADDEAPVGALVEIWLADLGEAAEALEALERETPRLAAGDLARIAELKSSNARRERRLSHIVLRLAVERMFGPAYREVDCVPGPQGKPALPGLAGDMSLAHAGGFALVAVSASGPVGVDLETVRPLRLSGERKDAIEQAAAALAPSCALPASEPERFLQAWVRLEALGKADGRGVGYVLGVLGVWGDRSEVRVGEREAITSIGVQDLSPGAGLFGAAAGAGASPVPARRLPADLESLRRLGTRQPIRR